jgi:hypothetical protein
MTKTINTVSKISVMDIHQAFSFLAYWLLNYPPSMIFDYPIIKQLKYKFTSNEVRTEAQHVQLELQKMPTQLNLAVLPPELMQIVLSMVRRGSSWSSLVYDF